MKGHSFRLQIVLWSVLISASVLLIFAGLVWWYSQRERVALIDASISSFGLRHSARTTPKFDPVRMDRSFIGRYGEDLAKSRFYAVVLADGEVIHRSTAWPDQVNPAAFSAGIAALHPQPVSVHPPPKEYEQDRKLRPELIAREPTFYTAKSDDGTVRIGVFANEKVKIVVGAGLDQLSRDIRHAFLFALPAGVLLIGVGSWFLANRALKPVSELSRDMRQLSAKSLDSRLEVIGGSKELSDIIWQYNIMLERLERSFDQATRFSADASHELKTPIAILRGTLERQLSKSNNDPDLQEVFAKMLEQIDRQQSVLENLLLLSRADSGNLKISGKPFDLSNAIEIWLEDAELLAVERLIGVTRDIAKEIYINGDEAMLQQVAHNLFSNAVRYNKQGGVMFCSLEKNSEHILWSVTNSGPQLVPKDLDRIFDRFYRVEGHSNKGTGLGLSLVQEIIFSHGGRIEVKSDEGQNTFTVFLPLKKC